MFYSPLRYPGGKNRLANLVIELCEKNGIEHYYEPYAGGASVALSLLLGNHVKTITLNDKDRSIYAFWYSVLKYADELCELIKKTNIDVENWKEQREVQKSKESISLLKLGFSTLFLNRTNFSGVINGGIIGGLEQKGKYKIGCRFNKNEIIDRIKIIAERKKEIKLFNLDALTLIDKIEADTRKKNKLIYFDPPYYVKAKLLYLNHYKHDDHVILSEKIKNIHSCKWLVSYDNVPEINNLYTDEKIKKYEFTLNHSASKPKEGKELLMFSEEINYA